MEFVSLIEARRTQRLAALGFQVALRNTEVVFTMGPAMAEVGWSLGDACDLAVASDYSGLVRMLRTDDPDGWRLTLSHAKIPMLRVPRALLSTMLGLTAATFAAERAEYQVIDGMLEFRLPWIGRKAPPVQPRPAKAAAPAVPEAAPEAAPVEAADAPAAAPEVAPAAAPKISKKTEAPATVAAIDDPTTWEPLVRDRFVSAAARGASHFELSRICHHPATQIGELLRRLKLEVDARREAIRAPKPAEKAAEKAADKANGNGAVNGGVGGGVNGGVDPNSDEARSFLFERVVPLFREYGRVLTRKQSRLALDGTPMSFEDVMEEANRLLEMAGSPPMHFTPTAA